MQRAHQTAQEIAKIFSLDIILAADLREGHFGKIQGLTNKEIHDLYGPFDYDALPDIIEAEPRQHVVARIMNYLAAIAQKHQGQHVAVVTHGWALSSLIRHLGYTVEEFASLTNESVTTLIWHEDQEKTFIRSVEHA